MKELQHVKKIITLFILLFFILILLTGCGNKCYVCGKSGANHTYGGESVCDDCYAKLVASQYRRETEKADAEKKKADTEKNVESNLDIEISKMYHKGDYVYVEASVTNNSDKSVKFVKLKLTYKDKDGNVVDTDSTYACGSEGLSPGETTKFDTMKKDEGDEFKKVSVSIYDFDIVG